VYAILFRAASESLKQISADPEHLGAQIGFIAMLQTWSRMLSEFIRRYLFHVLPDRFVKIRYYGILGNNHRVERLERCRRMLGCRRPRKRRDRTIKRDWRNVLLELTGIDLRVCQVCGGRMVGRQVFGPQRAGGLPP